MPALTAFRKCRRAAQSAGGTTNIANVHFVSIPSPQKAPKTTDHRAFENSFVFSRAQIDSAISAVSHVSSNVSRDIQSMKGKKLTSIAAMAAAVGFINALAIP